MLCYDGFDLCVGVSRNVVFLFLHDIIPSMASKGHKIMRRDVERISADV
jgi:hypothetical protein